MTRRWPAEIASLEGVCGIVDWVKRLNGGPRLITLGEGAVELLDWAYAPHLVDNVPHRHTHFEVCQVGAYGHGRFLVEGRPYDIGPGDLFIARPGARHQIVNTSRPEMELFWVAFIWTAGDTPGDEPPKGELETLFYLLAESPVPVVPDADGRISSLWRALRAVAQGDARPGYEMQLEGLMVSLLLAIAQAGAGPQAARALVPVKSDANAVKVRLAIRYVHDNLDRRLPVAEIADQLHLSARQLSRLFSHYVGASPAAYVEQVKLDRARALLEHTGTPIKGIAAAVGYESVHHFSRAFSRCFGSSPGAFRQASTQHVSNRQRRGATGQRQVESPLLQ